MTNRERAERARKALRAVQPYTVDEDEVTHIYDLMCDLGHLADEVDVGTVGGTLTAGHYALSQAEWHYSIEMPRCPTRQELRKEVHRDHRRGRSHAPGTDQGVDLLMRRCEWLAVALWLAYMGLLIIAVIRVD